MAFAAVHLRDNASAVLLSVPLDSAARSWNSANEALRYSQGSDEEGRARAGRIVTVL
jgi:hypothetical protein